MKTFPALLLIALSARAQQAITPPSNASVKFIALGVGVQRYTCQLRNGSYAWVLQEPVAKLLNPATSTVLGTHSKGPVWTWSDGSRVMGRLLQQQPSPDAPASIPWLLLHASSTGQSGALSDVTYVRRSETKGGVAPTTSCTKGSSGTLSDVPYQATYTFYTTR